jgi:hypothetical protein
MIPDTDKTYMDASSLTLGKAIGAIFTGLIEGGLTREEALEVIKTYVYGLAVKDSGDAE